MVRMFLVIGGDSEIGAATYRAMKAQDRAVAVTTRRRERIAPDRPFLDLAAQFDSWEPPQQTRAACICAAVSRIAVCAADPQGTANLNVNQTLALIENLVARDIFVLFLSTNQVFDGRVPRARADMPYSPVSEYGRQKVAVERVLRGRMAQGAPVAILRLAKVISPDMPLIAAWVADLSSSKPIRAFRDMPLAPIPTDLVCTAIGALLEDHDSGISQLSGPRDVAYADIGRFVAGHLGADLSLVKEISARDVGLPDGVTPLNTTLDGSLLRERYGLEVPDVWEVVERVISSTGTPAHRSA
jgi:dTDP-4-dehydrorhamnose reductase